MKAYTDVEQSKKLSEILPPESADMEYFFLGNKLMNGGIPFIKDGLDGTIFKRLPCWSLAALLDYLRETDFFPEINADECSVIMSINYYDEEEAGPLAPIHIIKVEAESFIDACYEMIIKLHEQKLL